MTFKIPIGMMPFNQVYGKAYHLSIEIEHKAYLGVKGCNMNLAQASEERLLELQGLKELRLEAYENSKTYKEKTKLIHDKSLVRKDFWVGQKVLLFNSCLSLMLGKLKSKWLGPSDVINVFPFSVVEIRSLDTGKEFKVNGHHLKVFNEREVNLAHLSLILTSPSYT
ncbi:uncharacterized protein LOC120088973 [Benincasa hispida]|uniref:uncharacterized protein LOC120088973 n=1 Tax=Benincasa hispida TaxID=102211 RepID=UPI00190190D9|nr:uncharacterized protein LOC120088973 [Benincasa hispida]